ncbi:helix-turn-helix domain-containing protein [Parvularcula bermudensis]|uniref:helix-turn-helix domain-containing protein n=1 Tax=Parvularcula bermudensis TaxID=208216 RepID=UPI0011D1F742|nr:helix-turn-helix domain-containing protein [Parvularcula bermudensis]
MIQRHRAVAEAAMPRGYGTKLRGRVIAAHADEGLSARAAGRRFGIGVATAVCWVRHWRETGQVEAPARKPRPSKLDPHRDWLVAQRLAEPDERLVDLAARLEAEHGVHTDKSALSRFFARCGVTFKKEEPVRWSPTG